MSQITFLVVVGVRGPIIPDVYHVGNKRVEVSYPTSIDLGFRVLELPKSLSTMFHVSWEDITGEVTSKLKSRSFERHLPIYDAIAAISELFLAYKLVSFGGIGGDGLRTIGIEDTLVFLPLIDGVHTGDLNVRLKNYEGNNAWPEMSTSSDPFGITSLALPHIGNQTMPVARRFVRCYELLEHGFYSEAFIVAFSVLDDFIQKTLHELLEAKGLHTEAERKDLLRGVKENRLKIYLGPIMKLVIDKDIASMWPSSSKALEWLNGTRNRIAHSAETVSHASAAHAIFACLKIIVVFNENGIAKIEIPVELFRHAKITAAWTSQPPEWVPKGAIAESTDYQS